MKHLTILLTMAITLTGMAQQMPYNPDANGDDFVGVDDVLGVLGVYDTALMQPDLQCDYEGTDLEQLFAGLLSGELILDSLYVEYLMLDSVETFYPGCPDPVYLETVLERSYMFPTSYSTFASNYSRVYTGMDYLGIYRTVSFNFWSNGRYHLEIQDNEISSLFPTGAWNNTSYSDGDMFVDGNWCTTPLPFPDSWSLDENGISVEWQPTMWAVDAEYLKIIPFWHEAE